MLLVAQRGVRQRWTTNDMIRPLRIGDRTLLPVLQESWWAPEPVWTGAENRNSVLDALYCRWTHDSWPSRHYCIITDIWGLLDFSKKNHSPVILNPCVRVCPSLLFKQGGRGGVDFNDTWHKYFASTDKPRPYFTIFCHPYYQQGSRLNFREGIKMEPTYKGADKSLGRPGRKQATATEDFEFHIPYL
jgi:hypothetical protein